MTEKNTFNVKDLLREFGAKNESDLQKKLTDDIDKIRCINCGKTISLFSCSFEDGNPICKNGCYQVTDGIL